MDTIDQDTDSTMAARPVRKHHHYPKALKRQMVEETLGGRNSVPVITRRYNVNTNQLFKWGQQFRKGLLSDKRESQSLVPITATPSPAASKSVPQDTGKIVRNSGGL